MSDLTKYQSSQMSPVLYPEGVTDISPHRETSLMIPVLRRWYIALITAVFICVIGISAVFLTQKNLYETIAAIRVAPVMSSILFSDKESEGVIPMYRNFKNTQADLVTSEEVLQRVADDLADRDLSFFKSASGSVRMLSDKSGKSQVADPVVVLRRAITSKSIAIDPEQESELIKIKMKSSNFSESAEIVNAFVRAYMTIAASDEDQGGVHKLSVLEDERKVLIEKLERQRQTLRQMAQEYGTEALSDRHQIMMDKVAALQEELTKAQMRKVTLQTQVSLLEHSTTHTIPAQEMLKLRHDFINSDLMVQTLTANIAQLEQTVIIAKQTLATTNPELGYKTELFKALQERLVERRKEVGDNFDQMVAEEVEKSDKSQMANIKAELAQTQNYEKSIKEMLDKEDSETIELGRKQLALQDIQDQQNMTKELYETVQKRIQELEMERKRPARISVAYYANTIPQGSQRIKFSVAVLFAAIACGCMLAILVDRIDLSLNSPEDVTKLVGIPIIGTTSRSAGLMKTLLPAQVLDDYQTICANLGLFGDDGIPKKLVVTSPAAREGKTTFSINFAASLAKAGKKILLIDGDLRKPDVATFLRLTYRHKGLQEILQGRDFSDVVIRSPVDGMWILTAETCNPAEVYDIIAQKGTAKFLNIVGQYYDHIIIDTPPVLAVPDALLWAKMADGVILTSLAGHTEGPDLKETISRLTQINAKILGTIMNNVRLSCSYNRYGHGYYAHSAEGSSRRAASAKTILLTEIESDRPGKTED